MPNSQTALPPDTSLSAIAIDTAEQAPGGTAGPRCSARRDVKTEQPARVGPQQHSPLRWIQTKPFHQTQQRAVIDALVRAQERPVGAPQAALDGEGLDQCCNERPAILIGMRLPRELDLSRQFDRTTPAAPQRWPAGLMG